MEELELELKAIVSEVDKVIEAMHHTPKRSNEYNYLVGKLEAYTDIQNMVMWRLNKLRNGGE